MEIYLINKIVREAVMHGADAGGSYDSNTEGLTKALQQYLNLKGIADDCCIANVNFSGQRIPQILFTKNIL